VFFFSSAMISSRFLLPEQASFPSGLGTLVPAMAVEKKSGCAYVPIADAHAVRTIGAARLRGRSFSRAQNSFLSLILAR
jgi:hypothetical protein